MEFLVQTGLAFSFLRKHLIPLLMYSLFRSRLAALGRAGVVSDHVTEPQGHRGITVVHRHYDDLLVRGALRQARLVQDRLWRERDKLMNINIHSGAVSGETLVKTMRIENT